jgi:hypothetical protein
MDRSIIERRDGLLAVLMLLGSGRTKPKAGATIIIMLRSLPGHEHDRVTKATSILIVRPSSLEYIPISDMSCMYLYAFLYDDRI